MQVSLRSLLIIPFVLQVVGITSLVGYLSYRSGQKAVEVMAQQLMEQTAKRVDQRLAYYLGTAQRDLARTKLAIERGQIDAGNLQAIQDYFFQVLQLDNSYIALGYGSATGKSVVVGWDKDIASTAESGYIAAKTENPQTGNNVAYLLDSLGQPTKQIQEVTDYDPRQLIWYTTAIRENKAAWTPIYPLVLKPVPGMLAVTPIYQNEKIQGVLFATVPMARVSRFLAELEFAPHGQVFIIEPNGDLVATSTQEEIYTVKEGSNPPDLLRVNATQSQNALTQATTQNLIDRMQPPGDAVDNLVQQQFEFTDQGLVPADPLRHRYITSITPYQDDYGLDWLIVTVVPQSDFMGAIQENVRQTALLCGLALLGSVGSALWLTHRILQPIKALDQASQDFAADEVAFITQPTAIREVESLRQTFQQMTYRLDESFRDLKASEQRFATLLENVPVGVGVFNAQGQIVWSNSISKLLVGQDTLETDPNRLSDTYQLYRANTNELYPVEQLPAIRALRGETVTVDDIEIRFTKAPKPIPLEVHAAPVMDASGQIIYAIVAFRDISERRENEHLKTRYQEALEQDVAFKTAALEEAQRIAQVGSWELDLKTGKNTWTKSLYGLLGIPPEQQDPSFDDILRLTHPDDRKALQQRILSAMTHGTPYELEHRIIRPDGSFRYLVSRSEPIWDAQVVLVKLVGTIADITDQKQTELELLMLQDQLRVQATVDSLTQVANRYQLDAILDLEWRRCQRHQEPIAILMVDIDYFKAYNDIYGHVQGDRCLRQVAQILQSCVRRAGDLVARFGGEEFTLVLPRIKIDGATQMAEQIQTAIETANIPHEQSAVSDRITLSIGIATFSQLIGRQPEDALRLADHALYDAKKFRNCYRICQT
jgi:diguanylate cyclase (GGDEF)-like protein/PAS domain S-box-containing protein